MLRKKTNPRTAVVKNQIPKGERSFPSETVAGILVLGGAMYALHAGITQRASPYKRPCLLSGGIVS